MHAVAADLRRARRRVVGGVAALVMLGLVGVGCTLPQPVQDSLGTGPRSTIAPVTSVPASLTLDGLAERVGTGAPLPLRLDVLDTYSHDPDTFTQGLEFGPDGTAFQSSGLYGRSWIGVVEPTTGEVVRRQDVDPDWFAEGLTLVDTPGGQELLLITWREGTASFRDPLTLAERRRASYDGEGWGVCDLEDGTVAMSDGTATLTIRSVEDFSEVRSVEVTANGRPVTRLNELECRGGLVWANVWTTATVVAIDPRSGQVLGQLDATPLVQTNRLAGGDVMNGIAAIPSTADEFLLTGKRWPTSYRVRISAP